MQRTPQPGAWTVAYFRFVHFSSGVKRHVPRWTRRSPNRTSQRFPRKIWQRGGKRGPSYFVAFRLLDRYGYYGIGGDFIKFPQRGRCQEFTRFHFLLFPDMCTCVYAWTTSYLPKALWLLEQRNWSKRGRFPAKLRQKVGWNIAFTRLMPQVVGGCIWAAVGHERSQNLTVCRSLGHS